MIMRLRTLFSFSSLLGILGLALLSSSAPSAHPQTVLEGSLKWVFHAEDAIYSSPALSPDGTIYVGSWDGHLYALGPDGDLKWKFRTWGRVYSSPMIAPDGTIYFGSWDGGLYAVQSSSPGLAETPWPMFHHDPQHRGSSL